MEPVAAKKAKSDGAAFARGTKYQGDRSPAAQRRKNLPEPVKAAQWDAIGSRTGTDVGNRIANKVNTKFYDTSDTLLVKYEYFDDIPADEFIAATGIPKKAAVWVAQNNNDFEQPFSYDSETDTFRINDPMDV